MNHDADSLLTAARDGFAHPLSDADANATGAPAPTDWDGRVRVQIWRAGECLAAAEAVDADPRAAVRHAAALAAARLHSGQSTAAAAALSDDQRDAEDLFLDIEAVDAIETITPDGLAGLIRDVEPGLHGLVLSEGDRSAAGWPPNAARPHGGQTSDVLRDSDAGPKWVKALIKEVRPPGARLPPSVRVQRFTTAHAVGPTTAPSHGDALAASRLIGGVRVVPQDAVTKTALLEAATWAGAWLARHQRGNGLLRYEYQPATKQWSAADSIVRQAGCAWSLAALARLHSGQSTPPAARRHSGQSPAAPQEGFLRNAFLAVGGITKYGVKRDGPGRLFYVVDGTGQARLGAIPLLLLAATELEQQRPLAPTTVDRLTATLLALQERDGSFGLDLRGLRFEGSEIYYAGQIVLALARRYAVTKRGRTADAVQRALPYYRGWWRDGNEHLSFLTWMLQACDAWHAIKGDEEAAEFAYEMADWALQFQHGPDHSNPTWVGAYESTPGIGTAAYTEGMLRALAIAKRRDDAERIDRYRRAVLLAMRFLLQLTVEPVDLAFIGGQEHRGAVRSSLRRNTLRCDNAQHLLMAALGTAGLLEDNEFDL